MPQKYFDEPSSSDFRLFLQQELLRRCKKNPKYSLRSFANYLKVNPSSLSQYLRGKRPLPVETKRKIAFQLDLKPAQIAPFLESTQATKNLRELSSDLFAVMSDWYHDAILELTRLPSFKANSKWIAKTLGITASEVNVAVERLVSLDFLEITDEGDWINQLGDNTTITQTDLTTAALRKLQKQILEKSITAIDEIDKPLRDHTSSLMTIDLKDLEEIKRKIAIFRRGLLTYAERKAAHPTDLYQLAISFFPLTKIERYKS
jgi:transcriptional regulator with XRE-family HTH domain